MNAMYVQRGRTFSCGIVYNWLSHVVYLARFAMRHRRDAFGIVTSGLSLKCVGTFQKVSYVPYIYTPELGPYNITRACNPWPHVANRHISGRYRQRLSQLLSLWRHSHYDVIRTARAYDARNPRLSQLSSLWRLSLLSWPRPALRTYVRTDTLPRLIYKDCRPIFYFVDIEHLQRFLMRTNIICL